MYHKKGVHIRVYTELIFSASVSLFAYLTIHMKWLGLTETQIGLIYGLSPFLTFVGNL